MYVRSIIRVSKAAEFKSEITNWMKSNMSNQNMNQNLISQFFKPNGQIKNNHLKFW